MKRALLIANVVALVLWALAPRPAFATTCTIPNSFTNGTTADANQVNANFSALQSCGNNIDFRNIGTAGIYASQIVPDTTAHATFSAAVGWTITGTTASQVPLTVNAPSGQSADIADFALNGVNKITIDSTGVLRGVTANFSGLITASGGVAYPINSASTAAVNTSTLGTDGSGTSVLRVQNASIGAFKVQNADGTTTYATIGASSASVAGTFAATQFTGSGAGLTAGTVPNAALVTPPVTSVTAGSTKITIAGTATAPTVDVNPANFAAGTVPRASLVALTANRAVITDGSGNDTVAADLPVLLSTPQTIAGIKTFSSPPVMSGASITAGTVPNASLVTTPVTAVTATGNLSSSGGTTPAITIANAPTFSGVVTGLQFTATGLTTNPTSGQVVLGSTGASSSVLRAFSSGAGTFQIQDQAGTSWGSFGPSAASVPGTFAAVGLTAGASTVQGSSNASTVSYLPPVYTAAGAVVPSTMHIVKGTVTATASPITITLTGAAVFANTNYAVCVIDQTGSGYVVVTINSASSFTLTANTAGHAQSYFAIGE